MERIGVLIVDDHPIVRDGLRAFLGARDDMYLVGEAANGEEAVRAARDLSPDVVLMDLLLPGIDGAEATRRIRTASPATKVVVLTSFADDERVIEAIHAGATGYVLKDCPSAEVAEAIRAAHAGDALLHPTVAAKLITELGRHAQTGVATDLTEREREVLGLIARGRSNREIAGTLVVSEKTVKTHVSNILAKLHLTDRTQAAIYAIRHGLAPVDDVEPGG